MYNDLRYAFRMLLKMPGFTVVAVFSLALGISANTTIFSVINTVILRPLPYERSERLVAAFETLEQHGQTRSWVTTANFLDWQQQNQVFDQMALVSTTFPVTLSGSGEAQRTAGQYVTRNFFQMLGVKTVLGRTFLPEDASKGVVVLSHFFWQRQFGGDPKILGRAPIINGNPMTVIGVATPAFHFFGFGDEVDFWEAIDFENTDWINRSVHWLFTVARLKPGVTLEQAQAAMDPIAQRLAQAYPETNKGRGIRLEPLQEALVGEHREVLYPLFGAVGFVLLIACANVANLLLAKASTRQKEIAIRSSLGAGRRRLFRQMLTESSLLALMGGLLGTLLSIWGIEIFVSLTPEWFTQLYRIRIDSRVLVFTLVISILTGIVFGLFPAWQSSNPNLNEGLKEGGRTSASSSRHRTRSTLVVAEVALALVLLISAGLMINSFLRLQRVDPGFNPDRLLTLEVYLSGSKYVNKAPKREIDMDRIKPQVEAFYRQVLERIGSVPGVRAAALIDWLPMGDVFSDPEVPFTIAGRPAPPPSERPVAEYRLVSPNYFRTMQIPLLKGRDLAERDVKPSPWVAVINRAMAEKFWPNQDPIGQVITLGTVEEERPREIVGVVENVRQWALSVQPLPEMYLSYVQQVEIVQGHRKQSRLHKNLIVRVDSLSTSMTATLRRAVAEVDKDQAVYGIKSMDQVLSRSASINRFYMLLLGIFAALALVLAAIGIYGVISSMVIERTREIGIRMALGARSQQVRTMVLKQGLILSLIGIAVGLAGSFAATRVIANFLFAVTAHDPITFILVSLALIGVSLFSTYVPARRATQVDPIVALRCE